MGTGKSILVGFMLGVLFLGSLVLFATFNSKPREETPIIYDIITPKLSKIMHPDMGGYGILHYRWEDESGLICYGNSQTVDCTCPCNKTCERP